MSGGSNIEEMSSNQEEDTIAREKRMNKEEEKMKRSSQTQEQMKRSSQTPDVVVPNNHSHRKPCTEYCSLTIYTLTTLILAGSATMHAFSWLDIGLELDLYETLREDTWRQYSVIECLIEVDYIFWAWAAVYASQVIWILYGIILTFKKTSKGVYLYIHVTLVSGWVHIFMWLSYCCVVGWVVLWNRYDYMRFSVALEGGATLFSFLSLLACMLRCRSAEPQLVFIDQTSVLIQVGLFVQNGIAAFATMTAIMSNYHLAILLKLEANLDDRTACYVSYGLLLTFMAVYFIIDSCLSDRHAQCVITPYILVILAYVGAFFKVNSKVDKTDSDKLMAILALVGAGSVGVSLLVKVIVSIVRAQHRKSHDRQMSLKRRKTSQQNPKV